MFYIFFVFCFIETFLIGKPFIIHHTSYHMQWLDLGVSKVNTLNTLLPKRNMNWTMEYCQFPYSWGKTNITIETSIELSRIGKTIDWKKLKLTFEIDTIFGKISIKWEIERRNNNEYDFNLYNDCPFPDYFSNNNINVIFLRTVGDRQISCKMFPCPVLE